MTKRDQIHIDTSDPRRLVALIPLTSDQLDILMEVLKEQMTFPTTATRKARAMASLIDWMRGGRQKLKAAQAVQRDLETPKDDSPIAVANKLVRMVVDRISPQDVERLMSVDKPTANRVHSLLREARVAP